jgi:hypothetical protein
MKFEFSRHALEEMNRRRIPGDLVETILLNPQQVVDEYGNRKAYQSIIDTGAGRTYLIRVILNDAVEPARVVTVYKTSKIQKYWRVP